MGVTVVQLFLSVIISAIVFLLVPVILCLRGGLYSNKMILLITFLNAIGATVACFFISALLMGSAGVSVVGLVVFSPIGHRLLKKHCGF